VHIQESTPGLQYYSTNIGQYPSVGLLNIGAIRVEIALCEELTKSEILILAFELVGSNLLVEGLGPVLRFRVNRRTTQNIIHCYTSFFYLLGYITVYHFIVYVKSPHLLN